MLVSFQPKTGQLSFFRRNNPEIDGLVGKYVQIFADIEKRTLAWIFAKDNMSLDELKNFTQIKKYGKGEQAGVVCLYIPKPIAKALKMDTVFKRAEVKTYKPAEYLDHNTYHYVNLYVEEKES